jgi:hypothetical protein
MVLTANFSIQAIQLPYHNSDYIDEEAALNREYLQIASE